MLLQQLHAYNTRSITARVSKGGNPNVRQCQCVCVVCVVRSRLSLADLALSLHSDFNTSS